MMPIIQSAKAEYTYNSKKIVPKLPQKNLICGKFELVSTICSMIGKKNGRHRFNVLESR